MTKVQSLESKIINRVMHSLVDRSYYSSMHPEKVDINKRATLDDVYDELSGLTYADIPEEHNFWREASSGDFKVWGTSERFERTENKESLLAEINKLLDDEDKERWKDAGMGSLVDIYNGTRVGAQTKIIKNTDHLNCNHIFFFISHHFDKCSGYEDIVEKYGYLLLKEVDRLNFKDK